MSEGVKVIDLFAGPGGLGEGFSSLRRENEIRPFKVALSVEKDKCAHQTLLFRSFFRQFEAGQAPDDYYTTLRQSDASFTERLKLLFDAYPHQARRARSEAWCVELGKQDHASVHNRITESLCGEDIWVLLGGPPCQAFSIAGRSRNKGNPEYRLETDERQYLYVEYLHVIAEHRPAVFTTPDR
ncbi:MAG: DNA cytosine methyltransferase, partial [Gammaproteobacteria bacterium]|nr:DNA cytosine methyltransferase [Gammaproteobacteria bacterium]